MDRAALLETLKLAAPALLSDNEVVLPILKSFMFTGTHVIASNDVIAVCLGVDDMQDVSGIVPGKKLISFLSSCNTKEAKFSLAKSNDLIVRCSKSRLTLPTLDESEWPFKFPDIEYAVSVPVNENFFKGIEICSAQSADTGLGNWAGSIIFTLSKFVGIYGVGRGLSTISHFKARGINAQNSTIKKIAVPSSFCKAAVPMSKKYGVEAELHISEDAIVLDWGEGENVLTSKLINVDMPNITGKFREMVTEDLNFIPIKEQFVAALQKAAMIGDKGVCDIKSVDDGWLIIAKAEDGSQFREPINFGKDEDIPQINESVAADLIAKRFDDCTEIAIDSDGTVMRSEKKEFVYLIANKPSEEEEDE